MARLATVIDEARRRAFVGRRAELARFDAMVGGDDPRRVLFVHGPGGIGKTLLLGELGMRARAAGRVTVSLDAREVDWSPEGLRGAFDRASDRAVGRAGGEPAVVLLDGYERFGRVDEWVRGELVPSLPAETVVVLAGREPPPAAWTTDPGWRAVTVLHPLGELSVGESQELVSRAGAPVELVDRLAALGHGHPLTLALLADAARTGQGAPDDLADAPDLVAALVARVVGEVPGPAHEAALAVCSHAWLTTEDLLRRAVGDDAPTVWRWLESRPFITRAPDGLHPHDLVRDALAADLLRRSRDTYRRTHRIVHEHVVAGLRRADAFDGVLWANQKMWLHRRSPLSAMYLAVREHQPTMLVPGEPRDHPAVLELIERVEGAGSVAAAARWLAAEPRNLQVIRDGGGVAAFAYNVLWPTDPALCEADPVVRAILDHVVATSPARPGEQVWIGRFVGGPRGSQSDPYAVTAAAVAATIDWITRPLAWSFIPTVDPGFWGPAFDYLAFRPVFELPGDGATTFTVYGNDWRRLSVDAWLDVLDERELTGHAGPPPSGALRPPPLDRAAFDAAVRSALGDLRQPDRLRASPLMGSILAFGYDGADVARLRAVLDAAIGHIAREPRGEGLARVLDRTFRHGAPSQEAAAAVLDLPWSTYRRHLAGAIGRLTDLLWAVEIGQIRLDDLDAQRHLGGPGGPGEHEVGND